MYYYTIYAGGEYMYQDNEREIFTVKNIKTDLYRHLIPELLIILPIFLSSLVIALNIYLVNELSNKNFNFKIYYIVLFYTKIYLEVNDMAFKIKPTKQKVKAGYKTLYISR